MFRDYLQQIVAGEHLDEKQMADMLSEIFSGQITDAQVGAFMAALATKGETEEELAGAATAMRRKAYRIQCAASTVVDTCGTGGDGLSTFNISTTTAFVVAGCGVTVAKHGNRSVSSKCGSADVLESLGVRLDLDPELVEEAVGEIGIGFLFAPLYHSAMRHAAKARTEVGLRSIFNMLGPLTNPAGANCQLIGVYAPELTEMFAQTLRLLGSRQAYVVHGHDGLDEITICAPTRVSELKDGQVRTFNLDPSTYFGELARAEDLAGGDPAANAAITNAVLAGEKGPRRNVVLLNAAAALVAAGAADRFEDGIDLARKAIDDGSAKARLEALVEFTRENAPD
ncbi:MAG: anthranilate phosphoribosyltransferase [Desulfobacterales bacterium]|nr:anthranilate phosphoribosyltransferase [Desulfobacterales bacterium]